MSARRKFGRWALPMTATAVAVGAAIAVGVQAPVRMDFTAPDPARTLRGSVVDETGRTVPDATVRLAGSVVRSDENGGFAMPLDRPALAAAEASGHLPRTQAVAPGEHARITLTSQAPAALSLRFGGDVMFGGGFFEPQDNRPALLGPEANVADHADLLAPVAPLLQDADLTAVNLETPLVPEPALDPGVPRPAGYHPTKRWVQTSGTEAAEALRISGVDIVSLANDHSYDALGPGLQSTVEALDKAGVAHFGAGHTEDEAWRPAIVHRERGSVAFLGCTTVDGETTPVPYVADEGRGGAAECSTGRLQRAVAAARAQAGTVVVMIHGGNGFRREQSPTVRRLLAAATAAGAGVAVAGHPHVLGGITSAGPSVLLESMGNLLYDQESSGTALAALARVDIRGGVPVHTGIDPLILDGYRPRPVVGALADHVARVAAGTVPGTARMRDPGVAIGVQAPPAPGSAQLALPARAPRRLPPGRWLDVDGAARNVRAGSDLLWGRGAFENMYTGPAGDPRGPAPDWEFGQAARRTAAASCVDPLAATPAVDGRSADDAGWGENDNSADKGVDLVRSPLSTRDVYVAPGKRVPVAPGQQLSLVAEVRSASPGSQLELRWYNAPAGHSVGSVEVAIPEGEWPADGCRQVRVDAVVPPGVVAARPFLRLAPPDDPLSGPRLAADDIRLIAWAGPGAAGRVFDTVEAPTPITVPVRTDVEGSAE
ncbi:CapA family protein [Nocardia sp. NPDC058499]|uniref:CapA family protein n=1 Tax=Nocardia sp. NPDC058499 TaxID=3346530 RepID=UPI00364C0F86